MRRILIAAIVLLVVIGSLFLATRMPGLDVQVLDVSGYRDEIPVWMPFRVTLGLRNEGREPVVIERIFVEPDLDDFHEAFSGSTVLTPPLRIEPGASASYQAAVMLLNANQLPERTYALVFRVTVEWEDGDVDYEFPTEFEYARDPMSRVLRAPF